MYTDLMIDLETLGKGPGAVFTQIGLCAFDALPREGNKMESRNIYVDIDSALRAGLEVDGSTLRYWLGEGSEGARREMARDGGAPLESSLFSLKSFVFANFFEGNVGGGTNTLQRVWGYGPSFDIAILDYAAKITGIELPWKHGQVRCVRTMKELFPNAHRPHPILGHVGEDDSIAQSYWVQNMWLEYRLMKDQFDDGSPRGDEGGNGVRRGVRPPEGVAELPAGAATVGQAQDVEKEPSTG